MQFINVFLKIANCIKLTTLIFINDIVDHLNEQNLIHLKNTAESLRLARIFVFTVLNWQIMLYRLFWDIYFSEKLAVAKKQNKYKDQTFMMLRQEEHACSEHDLSEFLIEFNVLLPAKNLCLTDKSEKKQVFDWL